MSKKSKLTFLTFKSKVEFASVHEPKNKFDPKSGKEFAVTLLMDDKERKDMEKLLKDNDIALKVLNPQTEEKQDRIKTGSDGLHRLTIKRNATNYKGDRVDIPVVDAKVRPISKKTLIGNGSTCIVEMFVSENPKTGKKGLKLSGIQVLDLVRFSKTSNFKPTSGFEAKDEDLEDDTPFDTEDDDEGISGDVF